MNQEQIKAFARKLHIFYTVYEIVAESFVGVMDGRVLNMVQDFDTEESAIEFIVANVNSYHSLTVIKRYE